MKTEMLSLPASLQHWGSEQFSACLKAELEQQDHQRLPLQAGLTQTSYVSDSPFKVSVMSSTDSPTAIVVRIGVFYQGIIAGSCCADDPSPVEEHNEYCELAVTIDKTTAAATIAPVQE